MFDPGFPYVNELPVLLFKFLLYWLKVVNAHGHFAEVFIRFGMTDEPFAIFKQTQFLSRDIAKEGVGIDPCFFDHMIFQHPMRDDHIRTEQLFAIPSF